MEVSEGKVEGYVSVTNNDFDSCVRSHCAKRFNILDRERLENCEIFPLVVLGGHGCVTPELRTAK
jgi:hypothetical protein